MPYALCPMPYALCPVVPHMRARKAILKVILKGVSEKENCDVRSTSKTPFYGERISFDG